MHGSVSIQHQFFRFDSFPVGDQVVQVLVEKSGIFVDQVKTTIANDFPILTCRTRHGVIQLEPVHFTVLKTGGFVSVNRCSDNTWHHSESLPPQRQLGGAMYVPNETAIRRWHFPSELSVTLANQDVEDARFGSTILAHCLSMCAIVRQRPMAKKRRAVTGTEPGTAQSEVF